MQTEQTIESSSCLNCGETVTGNYCSNCGQKFQPTKLPLRLYLEDTVETLFNVDNRVFKTLKDLLFKPGKVTKDYIAGQRASYLPPLRIYVSISVIYFLIVYLTESKEVFFVNLTQDMHDQGFGKLIQYALFALVPLFGAIVQLFHLKRKGFYVEYLIFAIHIHSIWFILYGLSAILNWGFIYFNIQSGNSFYYIFVTISSAIKVLVLGYLVVYMKRAFQQNWLKAVLKSFGSVFLYVLFFAALALIYLFIQNKL